MTKEWEKEYHNLLFVKEKNDETLQEVERIHRETAKFLENYPFKKYPFFGYEAFRFVCDKYSFNTVLDVGSGAGKQSEAFIKEGKRVTAIDYGKSKRIIQMQDKYDSAFFNQIIGDINTIELDRKFDLVWTCHVLEHQLNVQQFLERLVGFVNEGGIIAITVPPYKSEIVGGHVSIWNSGLLIYRLILAGVDCKDAHIKKYGYNISIVVKKKTINVLDRIGYDVGDLKILRQYFPPEIDFYTETLGRDFCFEGNLYTVNWD